MPWGSRRAAALVKSGGSRSSLAVAVASLSVTEPRRPGRARRARGEQSPGRRRAEPGWEQSQAGSSSQPRARRPGRPAPHSITQHATRQHRRPAIVAAAP